jgi:mannan polymerase II complex MNN11 subunit
MHFAYPGRKASHPPTYASRPNRSALLNSLRRMPPRLLAIIALGFITFFWLVSKMFGSTPSPSIAPSPPAFTKAPAGHPNVVLVTTINPKLDPFFTDALKRNRDEYAVKHGRTSLCKGLHTERVLTYIHRLLDVLSQNHRLPPQ